MENNLLPLHPREIELLTLIRTKYRYGSLEIITRDGLPEDIKITVERIRLKTIDTPKE